MAQHNSRITLPKHDRSCAKSQRSCRIASFRGFTSPSLFLLAVLAAEAPPGRPPPPVCALPCCGTGCEGAGGSSSRPTNTSMCGSHGGPPAGPGSTAHLLPVCKKRGRKVYKSWKTRLNCKLADMIYRYFKCQWGTITFFQPPAHHSIFLSSECFFFSLPHLPDLYGVEVLDPIRCNAPHIH